LADATDIDEDELTEVDPIEDGGEPVEEHDETEVQSIVRAAITDAADYIDTEVAPEREKALQYYRGDAFGDEEEGRSQYVSRDVHDTVKAVLPSLLRTFFGSQNVVEFTPQGPEDVAVAEQATEYVNWIITRDNPGFLAFHSALKDALIQRTGIIKYWWDESESVEEEEYSGIDDMTLAMILEGEGVEIDESSVEITFDTDPDGNEIALYSFTLKRYKRSGRVRLAALPPEEFIIDRKARSVDDATITAHRRDSTLSELVEMGYPEDVVEQYLHDDTLATNTERLNRQPSTQIGTSEEDEAQATALYTEAWIRVDTDGDGIAELRKFCCIGPQYEILHEEPAVEAPFADFCPDPEPHRFIGNSTADEVMDLQRVKSRTIRNMNDSLAQSIHPRTGVVEGQVNMDDVLNNETGAVIRMRREGAVQPFVLPFVGREAFPVLEYWDRVKEKRTGITEATQGLDGDKMQSSTRLAVQATVEAAQQQIELVARVLLETGFKRLYRGVFGLVQRHQDRSRVIRLRGQWVEMDPRSWNGSMDVEVNTALGTGTNEDKMRRLVAVKEMQHEILTEFGLQNPLVTLGQYSNTLSKLTELAGFRDSTQFFNKLPTDWKPTPEEPKPTPEELLYEAQRQETLANIEKKRAELELEHEQMLRNDDRTRDKNEADIMLRASEIEAKYGISVNLADILATVNRDRSQDQYE